MNDIDNLAKYKTKPKTKLNLNLKFGLSTLHCWIRFFECLLHLSYRLDFKKWQVTTKIIIIHNLFHYILHYFKHKVRSTENKALLAERKKIIQQRWDY